MGEEVSGSYRSVLKYTIWEPPQEVEGASKRFTIAMDLSLDLCFRKLLRRSDYWLDFYMSYVFFGPKVGSSVTALVKRRPSPPPPPSGSPAPN